MSNEFTLTVELVFQSHICYRELCEGLVGIGNRLVYEADPLPEGNQFFQRLEARKYG